MANPAPPSPSIRIGGVTLRGRSLSAEQGRAVALSVARTLAASHQPGATVDRLTIRLPASAIRADGSIDPAALNSGDRNG